MIVDKTILDLTWVKKAAKKHAQIIKSFSVKPFKPKTKSMKKKQLTTASQIIICIACIIGLSIVQACNSKSDYVKKPADTTKTFVVLITPIQWQQAGIQGDQAATLPAQRITKDTLIFDSTDTNTLTKTWKRDTSYLFMIGIQKMDSLNRPMFDTEKKPIIQNVYPLLPKKYVAYDYNTNPNNP